MKKKVFRERYYGEPTVDFIEEPTEQTADIVVEIPKKKTTRKTTKKGKK